ncbi:MAG TPA: hypothetical protein VJA26_00885 [Gammaproteobacteria bacterium]|nr:hypothetical protein [Gammaproteobacteria bacterium]
MLRRLRRWLGWDADKSSAARVARPAQRVSAPGNPTPAKKPAATGILHNPRLLDTIDNPKSTPDRPSKDGFDPYNTGAFNRSATWDKISKRFKR